MDPSQTQPAPGDVGGGGSSSEDLEPSNTERARAVAGTAGEQARAVAGTAADQAREVGQQAGDQVRHVAGEARYQLRTLTGQGRDQLRSQAETQTRQVSENLRTWSDRARALADGRAEDAGPIIDYVRDLSGRLSGWADRLDDRGFEGVVSDVQGFARRRPVAFIGLCALTGFAISRVGKSLQSEPSAAETAAEAWPETQASESVVVVGEASGPEIETRR